MAFIKALYFLALMANCMLNWNGLEVSSLEKTQIHVDAWVHYGTNFQKPRDWVTE
jgi:hypothetical protein